MIQINSELPNKLLDLNESLNEYDFVLFHLMKTDEVYRNYYMNMRKNNPFRKMILDNSAYEFFIKGEEIDIDEYLKYVWVLKPDYFILPDSLMDYNKTVDMVTNTLLKLNSDNVYSNILNYSRPIAVAQGESEKGLVKCIKEYKSMGLRNICIPFHNSFFKSIAYDFENNPKTTFKNDICIGNIKLEYKDNFHNDINYAIGRILFMKKWKKLLEENFDYIHMLGSHCPLEKLAYKEFNNIKSMDTGYPVKCGIAGYRLLKEPCKPNIIIDEFLNKELTSEQTGLIINNVKIFKNM